MKIVKNFAKKIVKHFNSKQIKVRVPSVKRFDRVAAQGELGIMRLPDSYKIPANAIKLKPTKLKGRQILVIGHSETGHHHVMEAEKTDAYQLPESLTKLLVVTEEDVLRHNREFDTHDGICFEPGKYMIRTLREYDITQDRAVYSED